MKTKTVTLQIRATYNEKGELLYYSGIPEDCQRVNVAVSKNNPHYKGDYVYIWGLGVPKELKDFLVDPNSF